MIGNYKLATGHPSGIIFTGILPNITFSNMNITNVWEGGLRLQNKTLNLALFSKRNFTICVVMQLWLNRSMYIKTIMSNGAHEIWPAMCKKIPKSRNGSENFPMIPKVRNGSQNSGWFGFAK